MLVLDEPDSSLDAEGEQALGQALQSAKDNKITTVVITHRKAMIQYFNKLLLLENGELSIFGHTRDVIGAMKRKENVIANNISSNGAVVPAS
jgi:ABC-type protease/lipase transport system fused ATPase/permease subunit